MVNLTIKEIPRNTEVDRIMHDEMTDEFQTRFVLIGEEETCLPIHYLRYAEAVENFEVRNSDVWVCSYPKTGTTWTQEKVWLIANDVDFEGAKRKLRQRFPFLERGIFTNAEAEERIMGVKCSEPILNSVQQAEQQENPRFIKTHLPFCLLPKEMRDGSKNPKTIYIMRNAKDTCVSYFHHCRLLQGCKANLEDFAKVFMADKAVYGSFWKHLFGYWNKNHLQNLLIITYEDMKKDLPSVIKKVANFLNKKLTHEQVQFLTEHLSFDKMKNNDAVNADDILKLRQEKKLTFGGNGAFIRTGTIGQYKEELSSETIEKLNSWTKGNIEGTSLSEEYNCNL